MYFEISKIASLTPQPTQQETCDINDCQIPITTSSSARRPVFFINPVTTKTTIDKIAARALSKHFTDGMEKYWVDLTNKRIYCFDPCPTTGECCSTEYKISPTSTFTPTSIKTYLWHTWVNNTAAEQFNLVQDSVVMKYFTKLVRTKCKVILF